MLSPRYKVHRETSAVLGFGEFLRDDFEPYQRFCAASTMCGVPAEAFVDSDFYLRERTFVAVYRIPFLCFYLQKGLDELYEEVFNADERSRFRKIWERFLNGESIDHCTAFEFTHRCAKALGVQVADLMIAGRGRERKYDYRLAGIIGAAGRLELTAITKIAEIIVFEPSEVGRRGMILDVLKWYERRRIVSRE